MDLDTFLDPVVPSPTLTPFQSTLRTGDRVISVGEGGEIRYSELVDPTVGVPEADWPTVRQVFAHRAMVSYRWARHFGPAHPEGAYESLDLSEVAFYLSEEQFEAARRAGWPQSVNAVLFLLGRSREVIATA